MKLENNLVDDNLMCTFCGKQCKSKNSYNNHVCRCNKNPNHIDIENNLKGYLEEVRQHKKSSWNKGLTKETSEAVRKHALSLTHDKLEVELELDDDGELFNRYSRKRSNARFRMHIDFDLSFEQYCLLLKDAGVKSSQIGIHPDCYVLARINDDGGYTWGNCRFITQAENLSERLCSPKSQELFRYLTDYIIEPNKNIWMNGEKWIEYHLKSIIKKLEEDAKIKKKLILLEKKEKAQLTKKPVNISYAGVRNSQYNTFWVTNDEFNSKWKQEYGDIPSGYHRGRILGLPYYRQH